jgi:transposase InsO family protein
MAQIARNITDDVEGFFKGKRYLIHDRDPLYTHEFLSMLSDAGIESVKRPPRSPNLNAYTERFVRSIKEECLEQMILFGEDALRDSIREFLDHFHQERNHQGLGNRLIIPINATVNSKGRIERRKRLGGLMKLLLQGGVRIITD